VTNYNLNKSAPVRKPWDKTLQEIVEQRKKNRKEVLERVRKQRKLSYRKK